MEAPLPAEVAVGKFLAGAGRTDAFQYKLRTHPQLLETTLLRKGEAERAKILSRRAQLGAVLTQRRICQQRTLWRLWETDKY